MTTTVNGFRYGEISRKQAGRFAEDGYQQGSFSFRNAMTMYDTGMTRRYPLRTLLSCDAGNEGDVEQTCIYTIHPFRISDKENFLVGFGTETTTDGKKNNVVIFYYWENGTFKEKSRVRDGDVIPMFATSTYSEINGVESVSYSAQILSEDICRSMRFAQYYDRLYIVSQSFRTVYLRYDGDRLSVNLVTNFVFNQDAKGKVCFVKGKEEGEGTVLFKKENKYYEDVKCTVEYKGSESNIVSASETYVSSFNDFEDCKDLNRDAGTYPGVVAIINDSLYLANTKLKPSTIWKSRTIGSSQWLKGDEDYSPETLHDFVQFQVVATTETALKDSSEWPQTSGTGYYETENSIETWYKPDYSSRLYRVGKYYILYSNGYMFYTDSNYTSRYTWDSASGQPKQKRDGNEVKWYYNNGTEDVQVWASELREDYPFVTPSEAGLGRVLATDYYWYTSETEKDNDHKYEPEKDNPSTYPVKKELMTYDLTNASELYEEKTTVDFVATDSCAVRIELNTGANDEVRFISSGCGKIIVGISTCEKTLPANFNAVSNLYSQHYSSYGSLAIEPILLGRSFFFFTTGRKIREAYLNDGYMEDGDVTALNHDIFDDEIVDTVGKGTPDPSLFSVLANGKIVQITYDRNGGLNSMARWDNDSFLFKSLACMRRGDNEVLLTLVLCEGKYYVCYFYEPTEDDMHTNIFYDQIGDVVYDYITFVETVYAEVYDGASVFGRFKKAKTMYIRPYHCGHIQIGNDTRELTTTNYRLEDEDYSLNIMGKMDKNFSMKMQSVGNEPMTILAIAWEA